MFALRHNCSSQPLTSSPRQIQPETHCIDLGADAPTPWTARRTAWYRFLATTAFPAPDSVPAFPSENESGCPSERTHGRPIPSVCKPPATPIQTNCSPNPCRKSPSCDSPPVHHMIDGPAYSNLGFLAMAPHQRDCSEPSIIGIYLTPFLNLIPSWPLLRAALLFHFYNVEPSIGWERISVKGALRILYSSRVISPSSIWFLNSARFRAASNIFGTLERSKFIFRHSIDDVKKIIEEETKGNSIPTFIPLSEIGF